MAKIDVSKHGIRVILNRDYYDVGTPKAPLDVEGTVLYIETHSAYTKDLIKQGEILKILCTYDLELGDTYVLVRWDSDIKHWLSSGMFALRSSKLSRCKTIWDGESIIAESTTPFADLQPSFHEAPYSFSDWTSGNKYIKATTTYTSVPKTKKLRYTYHIGSQDDIATIQEISRAPKNPESIDPPGYIDLEYQANEKVLLEVPPLPPSREQNTYVSIIEERLSKGRIPTGRLTTDSSTTTWNEFKHIKAEDIDDNF